MVLCWIYNIIWIIATGKKLGCGGGGGGWHSLIWSTKIGTECAAVLGMVFRVLFLNRVCNFIWYLTQGGFLGVNKERECW